VIPSYGTDRCVQAVVIECCDEQHYALMLMDFSDQRFDDYCLDWDWCCL